MFVLVCGVLDIVYNTQFTNTLLHLHVAGHMQLIYSSIDSIANVVESLLEIALLVEEGEVVADSHLDEREIVNMREDVVVDSQQREKHPVIHPLLHVLLIMEVLYTKVESWDNNHNSGKSTTSDNVHHEDNKQRKNHQKIVGLHVGSILDLFNVVYISTENI